MNKNLLEMKAPWFILWSFLFSFHGSAIADIRQEIDSRDARENEYLLLCKQNLYKSNYQRGILVANNIVYRGTRTCENGGIEGWMKVAPINQMFKVDSRWGGPRCSVYHQWSLIKDEYSTRIDLQHLVKYDTCQTQGGIVSNTWVEGEFKNIKWVCFKEAFGKRERSCQERIIY